MNVRGVSGRHGDAPLPTTEARLANRHRIGTRDQAFDGARRSARRGTHKNLSIRGFCIDRHLTHLPPDRFRKHLRQGPLHHPRQGHRHRDLVTERTDLPFRPDFDQSEAQQQAALQSIDRYGEQVFGIGYLPDLLSETGRHSCAGADLSRSLGETDRVEGSHP